MDNLDFSEEEIQEQLALLGYRNIPKHRLREFKKDLDDLIQRGQWQNLTSPAHLKSPQSPTATSQPSPPAYTKEKDPGEGFFLHARQTANDRKTFSTCQNRDKEHQQGLRDSYAQHSVAPMLQLPPHAPNRLRVEPDPDDSLHPPLIDSYTSSPDTQGRRFIKRKVLRKQNGQTLVCDESVYSEDSAGRWSHSDTPLSMYKMYNTEESDEDKNSLNSSFWSDGERQVDEEEEEEEKVEIGKVTEEKGLKAVGPAGDSVLEEKPDLKTGGISGSNDEVQEHDDDDDDDDSSSHDSPAPRQTERVTSEDDFGPAAGAEDSLQEASEEEKPAPNKNGINLECRDDDDDDEDDHSPDPSLMEPVSSDDDNEEDEPDRDDMSSEGLDSGSDDDDDGDSDEEEGCSSSCDSPDPSLTEGVIGGEDPGPAGPAEDSVQEAAEKEEPEPNRDHMSYSDDGDDDDDDESCSSSLAPSMMTSGYGTYRPEEQEKGDDHTITEFEQDEDDRSLYSFGGFDMETAEQDCSETHPLSMSPAPEPAVTAAAAREDSSTYRKPEESRRQDDGEGSRAAQQKQHASAAGDQNQLHVPDVDAEEERPEEAAWELKEQSDTEEEEERAESEDPDESSSNRDIRFIDSNVDFSHVAYDKMCEEWEGNLRPKKDAASCLEERLAELRLSTSAQRDLETDDEDVSGQSDSQSSNTDAVSMSAFESYIRGMTRTRSRVDFRPKPKSFIRPVISQQKKKTDPVAKYFQYKQLWDLFKVPGEKDRRDLRLEIKERLAYQPPQPKPRRALVPNTYVVPTEKKRSALRWEIRNDLANGVIPYKFTY